MVIPNELGLHARSAAAIAKLAAGAKSTVTIFKGEQSADAGSVLDLLSLACTHGTEVTIRIEETSDREVLDKIVALIQDGFGE